MSFATMLQNLQQIAAANNAKLGTGISNWKKTPTGEVITLGDKGVSVISTEYGKRLAVAGMDGDREVTLYFAFSEFKEDATAYEIVLFVYTGDKTDRSNCFKAVAL